MGTSASCARSDDDEGSSQPPSIFFTMTKEVLDSYRAAICSEKRIFHWQLRKLVNRTMGNMDLVLTSPDSYPIIAIAPRYENDYSGSIQKFDYIRKDVTGHAKLLNNHVSLPHVYENWLSERKLKVLALGGGPAIDLLAIIPFLDKIVQFQPAGTVKIEELDYLSIDAVHWEPVWSRHVKPVLKKHYPSLQIEISTRFEVVNICAKPPTAPAPEIQEFIHTADLITIAFVAREILGRKEDEVSAARDYFMKILEMAKSGAIIFIADDLTNSRTVDKWLQNIIDESPGSFLNLRPRDDWGLSLPTPPKRYIGGHYTKTRPPRLELRCFAWLLRKEQETAGKGTATTARIYNVEETE